MPRSGLEPRELKIDAAQSATRKKSSDLNCQRWKPEDY